MQRPASLVSRFIAFAALCCALVFAGGALAACGPDHEQAIRDALTQELDSIKNLDDSFLSDLASDPDIAELSEFGIDPTEFFTAYLAGFDYRIDDVTVDGETATATVVLTIKSFSQFNDAITANLDALVTDESLATMSEEELYSTVGQTVMDTLNSLEPVENAPITVTYELVDNTWTPTVDSQAELESALMAN